MCVAAALLLLLTAAAGCIRIEYPQGTKSVEAGETGGQQSAAASETATAESSALPAQTQESASAAAQDGDAALSLLQNMKQRAQEGMVINCDFPVENTVIDDVIQEWGQPDQSEFIEDAKGTYDTFNSKNVVFGFNKGAQVFEVRSYDPELKKIGIADVEAAYGNPDHASEIVSEGQQISGYVVNEKYKMILVFDMSTDSQNPKLDHYSVFYPQGTVNMMADDPGREW